MTPFPTRSVVLVADGNDIARANLASLMQSMDMDALQAQNGAQAIKVIQNQHVDLVIFDPNMSPVDGFELAKYIQVSNPSLPRVLITAEKTSDLLTYASAIGIQHILSKPVDPSRLSKVVQHILGKDGVGKQNLRYSVMADPVPLSPNECMQRAIDLARKNALSHMGGPYAAVVVDPKGYIIGEGVNLPSSRYDPIAHAEVMAIRKAAEYLQQPHLEGCKIYCTSQPTRISLALIESVGITHAIYGTSYEDILSIEALNLGGEIHLHHTVQITPLNTSRLLQNEALAMFIECSTAEKK